MPVLVEVRRGTARRTGRRPPRRVQALLRDADGAIRAQVEAECDEWRAEVIRIADAFASARLTSRAERSRQAAPTTVTLASQPGLFDRRAERSREAHASAAAEAERHRRAIGGAQSTRRREIAPPAGAAAAGPRALAMLPGIDGHLLSGAFIEQQLPAIGESPRRGQRRAATLAAWRAACATLGPASTPRTHAAVGGAALRRARASSRRSAWNRPNRRSPPRCDRRDGSVALLVSPWGERARSAVAARRHARRRSGRSSWCLIFNGLQLRIVDASRLYARRHLEIDLDLAIDNPRTFAALLTLFGAPALAAAPDDPRSLHALVDRIRSTRRRRLPIAARRRAVRVRRDPARVARARSGYRLARGARYASSP